MNVLLMLLCLWQLVLTSEVLQRHALDTKTCTLGNILSQHQFRTDSESLVVVSESAKHYAFGSAITLWTQRAPLGADRRPEGSRPRHMFGLCPSAGNQEGILLFGLCPSVGSSRLAGAPTNCRLGSTVFFGIPHL